MNKNSKEYKCYDDILIRVMKIYYFIITLFVANLLFAEYDNVELIRYKAIDISLIDTSELDTKLKDFLYKYYHKNYSGNEYIKTVKSMQFFGSYSLNGEEIGTIKLIKKRPNKYKSHIKKKDGSEQIIVYDGNSFQKSETNDSDLPTQWQALDINAPENLWIHYDQLFDSVLLNPKDPNKEISLGLAYMEDGQVIQPITIKLKNEIKITNFVIIRDHLVKRALIEFNHPEDPKYNSYTVNYENYESVNGILLPKKITAMLSEETIIVTEFSDVQFNLGVSDFFFKAQSL